MHVSAIFKNLALTLLLTVAAGTTVNANLASGPQTLGPELHQAERWLEAAPRLGLSGSSYDGVSESPVVTKGAGKVDDAVRAAPEPNRIYSARELKRRADEPGPFHNFPESFNRQIFTQGERRVISDRYVQYDLRGSLNGRAGTYEIGVRPSASGRTEVITHRFFRPDPQ